METQMTELRSLLTISQRTVIEIEDKSRTELMASGEETRKAIFEGKRTTAERDVLREAAERELAKIRDLLAGCSCTALIMFLLLLSSCLVLLL